MSRDLLHGKRSEDDWSPTIVENSRNAKLPWKWNKSEGKGRDEREMSFGLQRVAEDTTQIRGEFEILQRFQEMRARKREKEFIPRGLLDNRKLKQMTSGQRTKTAGPAFGDILYFYGFPLNLLFHCKCIFCVWERVVCLTHSANEIIDLWGGCCTLHSRSACLKLVTRF